MIGFIGGGQIWRLRWFSLSSSQGCGCNRKNEELLEVATYLIDNGPVLKDGDSVGEDVTTKATVRHQPSRKSTRQTVYALHYEHTGKAKGFKGLFRR